ncbi:MAG: hypothetical protein V5A18_08265 [Haloarculaceae archaeon]
MRAIAINVGANTNEPGFRGPVRSDGRFTFLPIPETEPTREAVPTYGDLAPALAVDVPAEVVETPVHLDPTFASYPKCDDYTYGDPHPVKAGPLGELAAGDYVLFYATLSVSEPADWLPPTWGAFVVGQFRLAREPVTPAGEEEALTPAERERFARNAHLRRSEFDARVLLAGAPAESVIYDRAVPLSRPTEGTDANDLVTDRSADSGAGPWWRRPLRFEGQDARWVLDRIEAWQCSESDPR